MATLTVVYWRDIPAQAIARSGRRSARRVLAPRFERAIDQAAMLAGLRDSDAYLGHWRRQAAGGFEGDPEEAVAALAARLEASFSDEVLAAHVRNGGVAPQEGGKG